MMPHKLLAFNVTPTEWPLLEGFSAREPASVVLYRESLSRERLAEHPDATLLSINTPNPVNASLLEDRLPSLRLLCTRSTGYNHIDLAYLQHRNVAVCNLQNYCSNAVAEHAMALLLGWTRRVAESAALCRENGAFRRPKASLAWELQGKTLGLWGLGDTGQALIPMAKAFGLKVLVHNRSHYPNLAETLGFRWASQAELLAQSDILSLHLTWNSETQHIVNQAILEQLKPNAVLMNVARGFLIDSQAVLNSLRQGHLQAFLCDVLPSELWLGVHWALDALPEGLPEEEASAQIEVDRALLRHPQVLATPHTAWYTENALIHSAQGCLQQLRAYLNGETQAYLVKPSTAFYNKPNF
jgi:D-lactate dehydrogenase